MTSFCCLVVGGLVSLLSGGASLAGNVSSMADLQKHVHEVASRVTAATVALVSDGGETGSGVIVSPQGLILTAAHVVGGDEIMRVVFADGRVVKGRVLGANFTRDAAMVQIMDGGNYPHVELGESDGLHVGILWWLWAIPRDLTRNAARPSAWEDCARTESSASLFRNVR